MRSSGGELAVQVVAELADHHAVAVRLKPPHPPGVVGQDDVKSFGRGPG